MCSENEFCSNALQMKDKFPNQLFLSVLEKACKVVLLKLHNCAVVHIVLFDLRVTG